MTGPVFLIGYRGTGKTTLARILAECWGWAWIDADAELERRAGKSIRQIFQDEGEPSFRDRETAVLRDLGERSELVVSTGGGVVLRLENREILKRGIVIGLTAPAQVLWQRLQADTTTADRRPNLAQGGLAEIESLLAIREPLYRECAQTMLDTSETSPEHLAASLMTLNAVAHRSSV